MNKALFLDRDGVINKEKNHLYKIEDFEFIDGVFETCKYFQDKGYLIIVITNQAGIARGKYTEKDYAFLTDWMIEEFAKNDINISKVYHCPHHPKFSGECDCRKPNPGMIFQAQKELDIDLSQSILVGDKNSDIEAGINSGIKENYLITTGHTIKKNQFNAAILSNLKEMTIKVSIIIPTYNAKNYLPILLNCLSHQSIKDFELLIIDSSSQDETLAIAKQYTENVVVIPQSEFDHGGTRAKAAQMAKGDILVYLTQDALPFDEFAIENIVKVFNDEKVGAAYGRQLSYSESSLFGKHLRAFNYGDNSYIRSLEDRNRYGLKTAFLSDSFAAYRKSALEDIGWFKDGLILGEDTYAGAKMLLSGHSLAYIAEAKVYHSHSYTVWQEFQRYFDIGVFHKCEDWILREFGKAEGEGIKYIKSEINYLLANGAWYLLPEFFVRNGMKYTGYKLGQKYIKLPISIIKRFSMHHKWWKKINISTHLKKEN